MDLSGFRRSYESVPFDVADVAADPFQQFELWFQQVQQVELIETNAAVLATVARSGRPSARHVLVKGVEFGGFVFFTNYLSRKASDLADNPAATLVFVWSPVARQVVVEGAVELIDAEQSDAYFASRPRTSQLGAWASPQSQEVASRATLEENYRSVERRFAGNTVPRPDHWGGYLLRADRVEFWQGRPNRLHDRICYLADAGGWRVVRLAP